jgi:hypothetical protein
LRRNGKSVSKSNVLTDFNGQFHYFTIAITAAETSDILVIYLWNGIFVMSQKKLASNFPGCYACCLTGSILEFFVRSVHSFSFAQTDSQDVKCCKECVGNANSGILNKRLLQPCGCAYPELTLEYKFDGQLNRLVL